MFKLPDQANIQGNNYYFLKNIRQIEFGRGIPFAPGNLENHQWSPKTQKASDGSEFHTFLAQERNVDDFATDDQLIQRQVVDYLRATGDNAKTDVTFAMPLNLKSPGKTAGHAMSVVVDMRGGDPDVLNKLQARAKELDTTHGKTLTTRELLADKQYSDLLKQAYPNTKVTFTDTYKNHHLQRPKFAGHKKAFAIAVKNAFPNTTPEYKSSLLQPGDVNCGVLQTEIVHQALTERKIADQRRVSTEEINQMRQAHYEAAGVAFRFAQHNRIQAMRNIPPKKTGSFDDSVDKPANLVETVKAQKENLETKGWDVKEVPDGFVMKLKADGDDALEIMVTKDYATVDNLDELTPEQQEKAFDRMAQAMKDNGFKKVLVTTGDAKSQAMFEQICLDKGLTVVNSKGEVKRPGQATTQAPIPKTTVTSRQPSTVPLPSGGATPPPRPSPQETPALD